MLKTQTNLAWDTLLPIDEAALANALHVRLTSALRDAIRLGKIPVGNWCAGATMAASTATSDRSPVCMPSASTSIGTTSRPGRCTAATSRRQHGSSMATRVRSAATSALSSSESPSRMPLVIEGVIVGQGKKALDIPRLRFAVRDAQGAEIYAWNTVLDQPVLKPGERASFRTRLASPPPEGRYIDIRFFSKRDLAGGRA